MSDCKKSCPNNLGPNLLYITASIANVIACNVNEEDIDLLANFFSALGDNLAIISSANDRCNNSSDTT